MQGDSQRSSSYIYQMLKNIERATEDQTIKKIVGDIINYEFNTNVRNPNPASLKVDLKNLIALAGNLLPNGHNIEKVINKTSAIGGLEYTLNQILLQLKTREINDPATEALFALKDKIEKLKNIYLSK